jgi:hypothetical protein
LKYLLALLVFALTCLAVLGTPFSSENPASVYADGSSHPLLPMKFAHQDHIYLQDVSCIECHHNYADGSGSGLCINCHAEDHALRPLIREQFHGLCMECHQQTSIRGEDSGPVRHCEACHVSDQDP